ncbi:DNA-binding LacI/PurR family transcriptional regulator [Nakamurella sp. UYEF19]|uniref:LacI family DNA-binding transcriptional regulator n=1 Tax=Nakamurella sp. UYEF19 TaxID=1756392 RepID=UPI0033967233
MADSGLAPMIGIVEVAALAGVSPATVSRALRGLPGVSVTTRENVARAAESLGYVASPSAAALTTGRTCAIGVLAPWISRWFFSAVIEGAQEVVGEQGYDTLLYPLGANAGPVAKVVVNTRALHKRVDGVLGLNVPLGLEPLSLNDLRIPLVTVGSMLPGVSGVLVDDVEVGYSATTHLMAIGHRRIAFLGRDPDDMYGFTVAADRERGYVKALREQRISVDPALIGVTGFAIEAGEQALMKLWAACGNQLARMPTAVFAVSDEVAMGVIYAARRLSIRIPEDLSVIGVDNHDMSYLFDLTTIGQPVREQGRIAALMLLDHVRTSEPSAPKVVRMNPGLIVRATTGPPRVPIS